MRVNNKQLGILCKTTYMNLVKYIFCFDNTIVQLRNKILFVLLFILMFSNVSTAQYRTEIFKDDIKTLTLRYADDPTLLQRPFLVLNDDKTLEIAFDQLSQITHHYSYTLVHCNADWTESGIFTTDYLKGFTSADITDYQFSETTHQDYTHYRFEFPNEDMAPTISGNYVIKIYEDNNQDNIIATVCLSIVEPQVEIETSITSQTSIELSGRYQQLDIDINYGDYYVANPEEITLVVQQNNRRDNMVFKPHPSVINAQSLSFVNNKELIFEGGNEYRTFDLYSVYILGAGVDRILFENNEFHALLYPSENYTKDPHYISTDDADGQFLINAERTAADEIDYRADYMYVHFFLPCDNPFFDGNLYVSGDMTYNKFDLTNRMFYSYEEKGYFCTLYLKQGGYNYQYLFLQKNQNAATTQRTEGSFWETKNEYTIMVYHRPFGSRYDHLIAYKQIY